jgi:hypothetical protein
MFENASIMKLFPIPVWAHALKAEDAEAVNENTLAAIEPLKAKAASHLPAGAPWQSSGDLHGVPEFEGLCGFIRGAAYGALQSLEASLESIEIVSCWADVVPKGAVPEAWSGDAHAALGGIYCVRAGEPDSAGLVYAKPNRYNSRNATVAAVGGTLIVFPAWLGHSFAPNAAEEDRITVGFRISVSPAGGG